MPDIRMSAKEYQETMRNWANNYANGQKDTFLDLFDRYMRVTSSVGLIRSAMFILSEMIGTDRSGDWGFDPANITVPKEIYEILQRAERGELILSDKLSILPNEDGSAVMKLEFDIIEPYDSEGDVGDGE